MSTISYQYLSTATDGGPLLRCPECGHDLRGPQSDDDCTTIAGVAVELQSGNRTWARFENLDEHGRLTDGAGYVARGCFSEALCNACKKPLNEHKNVVEVRIKQTGRHKFVETVKKPS